MDIFVFNWFYPPVIGGTEIRSQFLADGLAARGHRVTVLTSAPLGGRRSVDVGGKGAPTVVRAPSLHPALDDAVSASEARREVETLLDGASFDVVNSTLLCYPMAPCRSRAVLGAFERASVPVVDHATNGNFGRDPEASSSLLKRAAHVVANSQFVAEHVRKYLGREGDRMASKRLTVEYPSIISAETFRPDPITRETVRHRLGLHEDDVLVFFPSRFYDIDGSLSEAKQPLLALRAFAFAAHRSSAPMRFLAIRPPGFSGREAEESSRAHIRRLTEEENIDSKVIFLDESVGRSSMPQYYAAADVTLVPSVEGFGFVTLESLLCGVPVVGVAAGASPELVGQEGGTLVDQILPLHETIGDALLGLASETSIRVQMGSLGRQRAIRHFGSLDYVEAVQAVLSRTAARS